MQEPPHNPLNPPNPLKQNNFYDVWHIPAWSAVLQRPAANFGLSAGDRQVQAVPRQPDNPATVKTTTGDSQQSCRQICRDIFLTIRPNLRSVPTCSFAAYLCLNVILGIYVATFVLLYMRMGVYKCSSLSSLAAHAVRACVF